MGHLKHIAPATDWPDAFKQIWLKPIAVDMDSHPIVWVAGYPPLQNETWEEYYRRVKPLVEAKNG